MAVGPAAGLTGGLLSAVLAVGGWRCAAGTCGPAWARWRRSAAVVGVDALFGGALEIDAPFGNSPIGAGRFFGVGNIGSGFLVAGLVVAGGLALDGWGRRALPAVIVGLGAGLVALGAPWFGADAGGMVYGGLAGGVLVLGARRGRVGARRPGRGGGRGVLAVVLFALVDLAGAPAPPPTWAEPWPATASSTWPSARTRAVRSVTNPMALIVVIGAVATAAVAPGPCGRRPAGRAPGPCWWPRWPDRC